MKLETLAPGCLSYILATELGDLKQQKVVPNLVHRVPTLDIFGVYLFFLYFITSTLVINVLNVLYLITFNYHKTLGGQFRPHFVDYEEWLA